MIPNHHPLPETLISFVSGSLPDALSFLIVCHLFMCKQCAAHVRRIEILGGLMLSKVQAPSPDSAVVERAVAQSSARGLTGEPPPAPALRSEDALLPAPLARYIGMGAAELPWETVDSGVQQYSVKLPQGTGHMLLLRLMPGQSLLDHAHAAGMKLVLVLQGVLSDPTGDYVRGDVIEWTEDAPHEPQTAGDVACICLIASEARAGDTAWRRSMLGGRPPKLGLPDLRFRDMWDRRTALTATVAVVFGMGVGWLLRGEAASHPMRPGGLVQIERNSLIALGPLKKALETVPSGQGIVATASDGNPFRLALKMTFQNSGGDYCRQYQIAPVTAERYTGIACRTGDDWAVRIQALVPPSAAATDQTIPASGGNVAMDAAIGALVDGDPVVGEQEAAIMARHWKK